MRKFLTSLFAAKPNAQPAPRSLALESLEDRSVPAVMVELIDATHTLKITGTSGADTVSVLQRDNLDEIRVTVTTPQSPYSQSYTHKSSKVSQVEVDLGLGGDVFQYGMRGGGTRWDKTINIKLGQGDDQCLIDMGHGGTYDATVLRNKVDINLDTGSGWDAATAWFGQVHGARLSYLANLGGGNDTASTYLEGDLTGGGDAFIGVIAGGANESDNDEILFEAIKDHRWDGNGKIDIGSGSSLDVWLLGGAMQDTINARFAGNLNGTLGLLLAGEAGDDEVAADVTLYAVGAASNGRVSGAVLGGEGNDQMLFGLKRLGDATTVADVKLDGGTGTNDRWHIGTSSEVEILNCDGYYPYLLTNFKL